MTGGQEASLKCVVAWSDARNLCDLIGQTLEAAAGADNVLHLSEDSYVVWTHESTADIRDRLTPALTEEESLLVVEFETWSSHGSRIDSTWLLGRGH